jgi:hypothetical protein
MRWLCLPACCFLAQTFAQTSRPITQDELLLARARYHIAQTLKGLPNYTCTQTIERLQRPAPSKRIQLLDVVRLEVALVNGRELYKWPGSGSFEDGDLRDMVKTGATGTGQFAGYAQAVFVSGAARYTYAGEDLRNGRRLLRWDYVVPQNLSGFNLRVAPNEAIVGFHGSFWIDRLSLDLQRLEVYADDIPPSLQLQDAVTIVEYERARIGTGDFLLPSMSELEMVDLRGSANVNRARFSGCRQYTGQSTVTFDDPSEDKPAPPPAHVVEAPPGASLDVALETPITGKTSAIGDPITVVLKRDARVGASVIAPKGAIGHGRITFLRQHTFGRRSGYLVGLELSGLEFDNTRVRMSAVLEHIMQASASTIGTSGSNVTYVFDNQELAQGKPGEPVAGSILFSPGYSLLISRGTRMYWRTTKMPTKETE